MANPAAAERNLDRVFDTIAFSGEDDHPLSEKVKCDTHGEADKTYVCTHLLGENAGLGFNRNKLTPDKPFPDAWCDDCEIIRAANGGWNEESEKLTKISLLCSGCYERARIRNTRTAVTLDDLANLRWKCGTCEEWHTGPCLDFGYDAPYYWDKELEEASRHAELFPSWTNNRRKTFLDEDYCAIGGEHFFVRGLIQLPIIGTAKNFCWGVWGSLSRENFETLLKKENDPERAELPAMFSWLSTRVPEYPETLSLKMYAHIQNPGKRPHFELDHTDHPLSSEFHHGITAEHVRDIMTQILRGNE